MSSHEHHHHEDECCAHEASPTEITLNASAAGNLQTTLQVAGVDCAEEVSLIQRALKPLGGVREVRVNIMSGKAIIAHDETITPEVLIKVIGDAGLKAIREGEKASDEAQQRQKQRLLSVSISGAFTLLGLLMHWTHSAPQSVALGCFMVAIISGGWFIAPKAVAAARRLAPDMNLLMTIAVLGAAGIGEWSESGSFPLSVRNSIFGVYPSLARETPARMPALVSLDHCLFGLETHAWRNHRKTLLQKY